MPLYALGQEAVLVFGSTGTWGGYTALNERPNCIPINSESLAKTRADIRPAYVYRFNSHAVNDYAAGPISVSGDFSWDMRYGGAAQHMLLQQALGTAQRTLLMTAITDGLGLHQYDFGLNKNLGTGLSLEVVQGTPAKICYAAKINNLSLSCTYGGFLQATVSVIGADIGTGTASTGFTLPNDQLISFADASGSWAGSAQNLRGFNLAVSNSLATDRQFIGSPTIAEPYRSAKAEITGAMNLEFEGTDEINAWEQGSTGTKALNIKFTGKSATGSGSTTNELSIYMPSVRLEGGYPTVSAEGPIYYDVPFRVYAPDPDGGGTGTAQGLLIKVVGLGGTSFVS